MRETRREIEYERNEMKAEREDLKSQCVLITAARKKCSQIPNSTTAKFIHRSQPRARTHARTHTNKTVMKRIFFRMCLALLLLCHCHREFVSISIRFGRFFPLLLFDDIRHSISRMRARAFIRSLVWCLFAYSMLQRFFYIILMQWTLFIIFSFLF